MNGNSFQKVSQLVYSKIARKSFSTGLIVTCNGVFYISEGGNNEGDGLYFVGKGSRNGKITRIFFFEDEFKDGIKVVDDKFENYTLKILGHRIVLSDILNYIDKSEYYQGVYNLTPHNITYCEQVIRLWDLSLPYLDQQNKKCLNYIETLVANEK